MPIMVGYEYDAEGNRVSKGNITSWSCNPATNGFLSAGNVTDYVLGQGGEAISELAEDANNTMNWQRTYVYAAGSLIATYQPIANPAYPANPSTQPATVPTVSYRLTDWLGSLRVVTDASGVVTGSCTSQPYGDSVVCQGDTADPHFFTGKERDAESGNDYFGARYYSSEMGRFMSPDPSNWGVDFYYPQTWNHYSYAGNNPLSNTDPNGLWLTPTHESIIDHSFPGLSKEQRQILKDSSKEVDTHQRQEDQFMHGMDTIPDIHWAGLWGAETFPEDPKIAAYDYIQQNEQNAKDIQAAWIASGHTGIAPAALAAFGNALHTITDEFSPSHEGFQHLHWWGYPWHFREGLAMIGAYGNRRRSAEAAARSEFYKVFGSDLGQQATHEEVTHKIIYNPLPDSTNPQ